VHYSVRTAERHQQLAGRRDHAALTLVLGLVQYSTGTSHSKIPYSKSGKEKDVSKVQVKTSSHRPGGVDGSFPSSLPAVQVIPSHLTHAEAALHRPGSMTVQNHQLKQRKM
jgi:hypothetical protein